MRSRCTDIRREKYDSYGGRGIGICERWSSFDNFLADMGERPEGMTIERIDNDGDYEPNNCRWATTREQNRNRSLNKLTMDDAIEIVRLRREGVRVVEIADMYSITRDIVYKICNGHLWKEATDGNNA